MENSFVQAILYAYPYLKTVEEDYGVSIRNRALLSYRSQKTAEEVAISIAQDILEKQKLLWLKEKVESALQSLTDAEKTLVAIRYFQKERKMKKPVAKSTACKEKEQTCQKEKWSERKYFRVQNRLCEKLKAEFIRLGVNKAVFEKQFAYMDLFAKISAYLQKRAEKMSNKEKDWLF